MSQIDDPLLAAGRASPLSFEVLDKRINGTDNFMRNYDLIYCCERFIVVIPGTPYTPLRREYTQILGLHVCGILAG